jgi:Leu/Phe-tRNA-protein transferase
MKFSIDFDEHFRKHLEKCAKKNELKLGTYIKALLKKETKYKEKELV